MTSTTTKATTTTTTTTSTTTTTTRTRTTTTAAGKDRRHVDDVARAYDAWSAVYDGDQNPLVALDDLVTPRLFDTGGLVGRDVLDAGCGTGRHTARLLRAGARVTGIDASAGMLARAQERIESDGSVHRPNLFVHDLREPLPFDDEAFDLVVCTLVLEHAASLVEPIASLARVTRRRGAIVVSDIHPAMRATGTQANFTDPSTGEDVLPPSHAHTIEAYVDAARAAGLLVKTVVEHQGTPHLVERTARARKYLGRWMLVAFRFRLPA